MTRQNGRPWLSCASTVVDSPSPRNLSAVRRGVGFNAEDTDLDERFCKAGRCGGRGGRCGRLGAGAIGALQLGQVLRFRRLQSPRRHLQSDQAESLRSLRVRQNRSSHQVPRLRAFFAAQGCDVQRRRRTRQQPKRLSRIRGDLQAGPGFSRSRRNRAPMTNLPFASLRIITRSGSTARWMCNPNTAQ